LAMATLGDPYEQNNHDKHEGHHRVKHSTLMASD
jgi:hypothetical protein